MIYNFFVIYHFTVLKRIIGSLRYLQPPSAWVSCALESRELLAICLKKLKGLNKVHLVDAGFVWTEPHSKRVKVKLTVQKEVCRIMGNERGGWIPQMIPAPLSKYVVLYEIDYCLQFMCPLLLV